MKITSTLFIACAFLFASFKLQAQCPGQSLVEIIITPDGYPGESSWDLSSGGNIVATGTSNSATVCVPSNSCLIFNMYDSYGDGMCCAYGAGGYQLKVNGSVVGYGGDFDFSEQTILNCPAGSYCNYALPVTTGMHTAPANNTYYIFTAPQTGVFEISTCGLTTCDTKLWIYGNCNAQSTSPTNVGTLFFDDNAGGCGEQARIEGYFQAGEDYIIRVGFGTTGSCGSATIPFEINFLHEITGCTDAGACNYNPLATLPGQCYYYPDPNCPDGPDLEIDENAMINSLNIRPQMATNCMVVEGCMNGYGERTVLAFDTHIRNIGSTDYYIGNPTSNPGQFTFGNCHGHAHYEGYADYVLYDTEGNLIPIGQKNGFCVMDLECDGGGSGQYGCSNMGITAGCGDIYSNYLDCQWIDITDVDTGQYVLAVKVNWDQSPDALGRFEMSYENNWAQACIHLTMDANGNRGFQIIPDCNPVEDCLGHPYGTAVMDCNGDCDGQAVRGDVNNDLDVTTQDATDYITGILNEGLTVSPCRDISADGIISVWDAGLANNCSLNGPNNNNCEFPNSVVNPDQTVTIGYTTINSAEQYIDVYVKNPNNRIVGYEFTVSGITIGDVESLISPVTYPVTPRFLPNGNKVIGLSLVDSTIPKNLNPVPFVRIHYASVTDAENICVSSVVHVLNPLYEPVVTVLEDQCLSTLSVDEAKEASFKVFPNPAVNQVTVTLKAPAAQKETVQLLDANGKLLSTYVLEPGQQELDIPVKSLASGWYTLKLNEETVGFIRQ